MKSNPVIHSLFFTLIWLAFTFQVSAQWSNISSNPQQYFRQLCFPSSEIGYAILDDSGTALTTFHKSTNAGLSWQQIILPSVFSTADFIDMHFPSNNVGYIAFRAFNPSLEALVYKSTDGGDNWSNVSPANMNLGNGYMGVHFINNDTGFAFSGNTLYKTINGGSNWTSSIFTTMGGPLEFDFNQNQHGMIGAWDGTFGYKGFIYTTTDGGTSWDTLKLPFLQSAIREVELTEDNVAYGLTYKSFADGPALYRSDNGGASWDSLSMTFLSDSVDMASDFLFLDAATGYVSTYDGYIYITQDSGKTWQIDHIEQNPLNLLAASNQSLFSGGPLNTLLKKTFSTSVNELPNDESFTIYPNPASDHIQITFPNRITGQLIILDAKGAHLREQSINNLQYLTLDMAGIGSTGMYFIKVQTKHQVLVEPFLVK